MPTNDPIRPPVVPPRAAVLVLRVWTEGPADDPQLRIRVITRTDVVSDAEDSVWMSSIAQSVDYVRSWLNSVAPAP